MRDQLVQEAAQEGRLEALVALRDRLARAIDDCTDAGDLSALALRFTRVLEQISELGGGAAEEEDDEIAERRRRKLSAASSS